MSSLGVCMSSMLVDVDVSLLLDYCWCCYTTPPSEQLSQQLVVYESLGPVDMASRSGSVSSVTRCFGSRGG